MSKDFFTSLENTRPFLKMSFEGFAKSGKTYTAAKTAIGLHKYIGSTKPIVWVDTEKAIKALKKMFNDENIKVETVESRTLADLVKAVNFCLTGEPNNLPNGADILVIDSISHIWENFVETYKKQKGRSYISIPDWGIIKPKWKKEFSDLYVMSNLHIIFTGRAAYEYEEVENEETHKIQTVKSGIKMRAETETAFEPDLTIRMERMKDFDGKTETIYRRAQVTGDRTDAIDGKFFKNPTFEDFKPTIDIILEGKISNKILNETPDDFTTNEENYQANKKQREILLEEIEGLLRQIYPGMSAQEKKSKIDILEELFKSRSWTNVTTYSILELESGLSRLRLCKPQIDAYLKSCFNEGIQFDNVKIINILKESITKIN